MNRSDRRDHDKATRRNLPNLPFALELVSDEELARTPWPPGPSAPPVALWRSRFWVVQLFALEPSAGADLRMSVRRANGSDGITWDDLFQLKAAIGLGLRTAVEVYPSVLDVVDVANMRHLWFLPERPAFAWHPSWSTAE